VQLPHGVVTFLLSDVVGLTQLWEALPNVMPAALARHDELIAAAVTAHDGVLLKARGEGDSAFCVFALASDAAAAIDAQTAFAAEPWPDGRMIRVRMALHTGQALERDGDHYGRPVNRAVRLRAVAAGGQILVSQATAELIVDHLSEGTRLVRVGAHALKDLDRPEAVYVLDLRADGHGETPLDGASAEDGGLSPQLHRTWPSPFVGRAAELRMAAGAWQALHGRNRGRGCRVLVLSGEPGIGKTRLASEIAKRARAPRKAARFIVRRGCSERGPLGRSFDRPCEVGPLTANL